MSHPFEFSGDGRCSSGVLSCRGCGAWYPISNHVLDLLPEDHAEPGSRDRFFAAHRAQLDELDLDKPEAVLAARDFAAQAHQREHFDELARREDRFSYRALGQQPFQRAVRSLSFEEWAPLVPAGSLVLDIGCADGLSTFDIASRDVEALGFDISGELVRRAADRAQRAGIRNVSFMVADADAIPVADGSFDCVLCYGSLHHVPDPAGTLVEAARALRDGGSYIGVENHTTPLRPIFDFLMRLRPIWLEEAGGNAQFGAAELERWRSGSALRLNTRPTVFVPPHLCNLIGERAARWLLRFTDRLFGRIPLLRRWGGLVSISGRKSASAAD
jgi:ubiquinone/menaquinone biosynthesis C-methylase UbiE